jgi:cyclopropane fatty-acyl-phospholipid synthase-like methyltransferase
MAANTDTKTTRPYLSKYDSPTSSLLSRIWGGHLHMGLFEDDHEPLVEAQMRANRRMADGAALRPGDKVLELACGIGGTARFLAQHYGVQILATNIAEAQIREAVRLTGAKELRDSIKFAVADFHDLPCADEKFDCWWCQEALLYSTDKRRVLTEALRVIRPGGRIILSDLVLNSRVTGETRNHFIATVRAAGMWSLEQWDRLLAELNVEIIEREDWSQHTRPTFEHVYRALANAAEAYRASIGDEAVNGTFERVQLEAARAGDLGWCYYALRAPSPGP